MNFSLLWIALLELIFVTGTILHWPYFNGSPCWQWSGRELSYFRTIPYLALPLIPYIYTIVKIEKVEDAKNGRKLVLMLATCNFLFQVAALASDTESLAYMKSIVMSRRATSYFYDAYNIKDVLSFLANFHTLDLRAHSSAHPPGPILFYSLAIQIFGADLAPYLGGLLVGLMASLRVPILYLFSGLWTQEPKPRLTVCAVYALIPGVILFLTQFDQFYPVLSTLMIHFWEKSLRESTLHAVYFGLVLFIATFFAYRLLMIGTFHLLSAAFFLSSYKQRTRTVLYTGTLTIGTTALCYLILFLSTGFNPVLSLLRSYEEASRILRILNRPHMFYLVYNFYEFFLGSGTLLIPLLFSFAARTVSALNARENETHLFYTGLATILVVDLIGFLRSETTRLWLFLQPLALIPIGLELARLGRFPRWSVLAMLWVNWSCVKFPVKMKRR